ncbi:MAG: ABC transporter permease [Thaumarchaeota archaeon]|nr:ABC transporter permease [Nitrososphaerota archaeon]
MTTVLPEKEAQPLPPEPQATESYGEGQVILQSLRRNKTAFVSVIYVIIVIIAALVARYIAPYDPLSQNLALRFQGPTWAHIFGLDEFGRDIFSRILDGASVSLQVGIEVVAFALGIGVIAGTISGYFGGIIDSVIMRFADVFLAFPGLVLAIGISAALGTGITNVVIALVVTSWPTYARVIRGQTLSLKGLEFITSARAIGAGRLRIIASHIIPNTLPPVLVLASLGMGGAILAEAGLSFLGLGIAPPNPSWGNMVSEGQDYILQAPHISVIAGLTITITVLAFNLLGDGLRDALDPKLRI